MSSETRMSVNRVDEDKILHQIKFKIFFKTTMCVFLPLICLIILYSKVLRQVK